MIGKTILHYNILAKLGRGGMGVVYKAHDTRLERIVALKFLPTNTLTGDEERKRFKREAKAAAALNHPNICHIYAIDEADEQLFIVMEFIDGKELGEAIGNDQLSMNNVIEIASQIASGLQAAHARGIVHRDIKSANIMVIPNESGARVKIMDFGLAKIAGGVQVTKTGMTLGTVAYMSPEQARGESLDHRTDIWAFGVVLYEMLTGQLPFQGEYEQAVMYSILNEEPQPIAELRPDAPKEMQRIIKKALAKDREARYQNMETVLNDLKKLTASMEPVKRELPEQADSPQKSQRTWLPISIIVLALVAIAAGVFAIWPDEQTGTDNTRVFHSIAVLPFSDLSPNKDQEYFCDGMTEEILTKLAQLRDLKVIARTSVMQYKNTEKTIREIGEELGVETVLEGSVRKAGDDIRVTAQLIKSDDETHLWASNYDRKLQNIFALQEEVAKAIAEALHVQMTPQSVSALEKSTQENLTAYDLVMRGKYEQFNKFDNDRAMTLFDRALAIDSTYVPAIVAKAGVYHQRWVFGGFADMDALRRKRELAELAVKLDPQDPEALPMLAHAYITSFDENIDTVYETCKKALAHNPNSHWALEGTAFFFINWLGMYDQGVEYFKLAVERDPFGSVYYNLAGAYLTYLGEYDEAAEMFSALQDRVSGARFSVGDQALLEVLKGNLARADSLVRQAERFNLNLANINNAYLLAARGQKAEALALGKDVIVYMLLGMHEEALAELQKRAEHPTQSQYQLMTRFPLLEPLRQDARFIALVEKEKKKLEANMPKYRDLMVE